MAVMLLAGNTWRVFARCGLAVLILLSLTVGGCGSVTSAPPATTSVRPPSPVTAPLSGWRPVQVPAQSGVMVYKAITATGPADAWAVGQASGGFVPGVYPLVIHWNGTRWQRMPLPAATRRWEMFTSVVAASPANVWVTAASYTLQEFAVIYHYDGVGWTEIPVPAHVYSISSMAVSRDGHLWITGHAHLDAYVARWDGRAWTLLTPPGPPATLTGIAARTDSDVWVTGDPQDLYHWDGEHWTRAVSPVQAGGNLPEVIALSASDVWAAGAVGGFGIRGEPPPAGLLHWDGHHWSTVQVPLQGDNPLSGITPDGAGGIWVIPLTSSSPGPKYLHWHAGQWTVVSAKPLAPLSGEEDAVAVAQIPGTQQVWSADAGANPVLRLYTP